MSISAPDIFPIFKHIGGNPRFDRVLHKVKIYVKDKGRHKEILELRCKAIKVM